MSTVYRLIDEEGKRQPVSQLCRRLGVARSGFYVHGDPVAEGRVGATVPMVFSADETADIGRDTASPVSDDYAGETSVFTGTVRWVQIDLGDDAQDADRLITPGERLRVAMARR